MFVNAGGLVAGRAKQRQHADDAQDEQGQHAERDRHGQEVERLAVQVEAWRREVAAILELADELKDNTIEALLRKSDLEVGLEVLLGQEPHRRRRQQQT